MSWVKGLGLGHLSRLSYCNNQFLIIHSVTHQKTNCLGQLLWLGRLGYQIHDNHMHNTLATLQSLSRRLPRKRGPLYSPLTANSLNILQIEHQLDDR